MKIALGTFACTGIRDNLGSDIPAGVQAALVHYTRKLKSGRPPIGLPRFGREQVPQDPEMAFDLPVDAETSALLEQEAERQGTTVSQLAVHSVMVYLAELDFLAAPPRVAPMAPSVPSGDP